MLKLLRQPFPPFVPSIRGIVTCALAGFSVIFVLFVIQPFGMDKLPALERFITSTIYGLTTFIISVIFTCILPLLIPGVFIESKWTVAREIIFFLVVVTFVSLGNLLVAHWRSGADLVFENLLESILNTYSIAFIPIILSVLVKQQHLNKKYKIASLELNARLQTIAESSKRQNSEANVDTIAATEIPAPSKLLLTGDNQDERLELSPASLIVMAAANNYVKIFYRNDQQLRNSIFRTTLKNLEQQIGEHTQFVRCHRSYLVNLTTVLAITGNAQGYKLHLTGMEEPIPVGRIYNGLIKERLGHL